MSTVQHFPTIENELDQCSGCLKDLIGEYWEIQLPTSKGFKNIGLCDACYEDAKGTGIV